ncbi:MAG: RimK family alpha-L-glutamate ligase [Desulfobacteraceae bacterium]|nr:MAG: RimK family alpha-L-glutamate ligase [Desulfobacteraceae bacterium]
MDEKRKLFVALGSRLKGVPEVLTLGVKPNFMDYSEEERDLIAGAAMILYPTANYAQFFTTLGKPFFPSLETCLYADEKIKQSTLFSMLGIPHPRTRIYYHLHHRDILGDFSFPFVAKLPRASSRGRGVYKIENSEQLNAYLRLTPIAYIQEYLPHERDLRVILINYEPILSYWRQRDPSNFRANLHQGGTPQFLEIPHDALSLARRAALQCKFNDVGLDLIQCKETWYVIEANMEYGREGLRMKGMNLKEILREKLLSGDLMPPVSGQVDGATAGPAAWVV